MSIVWFRKCLRIHDNASLIYAIELKKPILPLFILDPNFIKYGRCGINSFQTLVDLDKKLQNLGSKLIVLRGSPVEIFELLFKSEKFSNLFYEKDTEPYALTRDESVDELCIKFKVSSKSFWGHTLYNPEEILNLNKGLSLSAYSKFMSILTQLPKVEQCQRDPKKGEIISFPIEKLLKDIKYQKAYTLPNLDELVDKKGIKLNDNPTHILVGGETEGLKILYTYLKDKKKVADFEKPKTSPAAFNPASTTVLSPHLKFGSVSIRKFYFELVELLKNFPKHSKPPCSLLGQIYWREFFYVNSYSRKNFHLMKNNTACKDIDWYLNNYPFDDINKKISSEELEAEVHLKAWAEGRTGYPWIDAIMIQLRKEGWIHHLARHSVACFLTRGDLYINWERGQEIFEELLLDADYALNAGNWLWLSGTSVFFRAYFRLYSPTAFPKKYDPNGDYIRNYIPQLKNFPKEFIYEPWKASKALQQKLGCIIGRDYPERIVIHEDARKKNMEEFLKYFGKGKERPTEKDDRQVEKSKSQSRKQISDSEESVDEESEDESLEKTSSRNNKINLNRSSINLKNSNKNKIKENDEIKEDKSSKSTPKLNKSNYNNKSKNNNQKSQHKSLKTNMRLEDLFGDDTKKKIQESKEKDDLNDANIKNDNLINLEEIFEKNKNKKISKAEKPKKDAPKIRLNRKNNINSNDDNCISKQISIENSFSSNISKYSNSGKRNYSGAFKEPAELQLYEKKMTLKRLKK